MQRKSLIICLLLLTTTLAVFWQVHNHDFVDIDDPYYISDNPQVKTGLTRAGFIWAFTTTHVTNWHPLTWLSHMLDCQLYGVNPKGHHLTNVVFHHLTVFDPEVDDRGRLAQWFRCRPLCLTPPPRGISRLGGRTQRRAEHVFLDAYLMGLFSLCETSSPAPIPAGFLFPRFGPHGQAHAGDSPLCTALVGLLAAKAYRFPKTGCVPSGGCLALNF